MLKLYNKFGVFFIIALTTSFIIGCNEKAENNAEKGAVYVKPSIDRNGRYRKGHVRRKVSTKKDAAKSRARSKYYYHTRGKYRKK
jgi:hypothetical protein